MYVLLLDAAEAGVLANVPGVFQVVLDTGKCGRRAEDVEPVGV